MERGQKLIGEIPGIVSLSVDKITKMDCDTGGTGPCDAGCNCDAGGDSGGCYDGGGGGDSDDRYPSLKLKVQK